MVHEREDDGTLERFLGLVHRAGQPDVVDALESLPAPSPLSQSTLERSVEAARIGRAIAKNELSLGQYISNLRIRKKLSRADLGKLVRLSPDAISQLEDDRITVSSITAQKMALLAVVLDALKMAAVELLQRSLAAAPASQTLPRLTRMGSEATPLEAERARRHTQSGGPRLPMDEYLSAFSNAYDAEKVKSRQS